MSEGKREMEIDREKKVAGLYRKFTEREYR